MPEERDLIAVTVRLFGTVRRFSQAGTPGTWRGQVPRGISVRGLIELVGSSDREVAGATVDEEFVGFDHKIMQDAEVKLVTPIGGG
jgi:molybdopterin converting factor small subunit